MWRTPAMIAVSLLLIAPGVPANADPDNADADAYADANYSVFLQAIAADGIVMDGHQAIREGQAICKLMQPPNNGSLWDAAQKLRAAHSDWEVGLALHFADRSVQDICPHRGSF